jgi:hypothetical protein
VRAWLGLAVACLAVVSAGRMFVGEVRGFVDRGARAELDASLGRALDRWAARLPAAAVVRFDHAAASATAGPRLAQLRFQLAPRRVVRTGEAAYAVVEANCDEVAGRGELELLDELDKGLWLCRTRR